MNDNYISNPSNMQHLEGSSIDFKKTFDLNGTDNDEMLRLYLRKAGLSDDIEYLTPEQRRAFIYDIIKSNKMPGYWVPSTMKTSAFTMAPPAVRPPPPPPTQHSYHSNNSSPFVERRNISSTKPAMTPTTPGATPTTPTVHYATLSGSSSTGSLQSLAQNSSILPNRFVAAPTPSPPSPSTFITGAKGTKYEISGPMNFQHIAGDMTRDRTRNAFDLSMTMNDNVLKKYMIERGIKDEDVNGMKKQDIIYNIVQSRFQWMPHKRNTNTAANEPPNLSYATISNKNELTPQPSPQPSPQLSTNTFETPSTSIPENPNEATEVCSNFSLIASRFADVSDFPNPDTLFDNKRASRSEPSTLRSLPPELLRPAPPPRKSKPSIEKLQLFPRQPPPPPSSIVATNIKPMPNDDELKHYIVYNGSTAKTESLYATIRAPKKINTPSICATTRMPSPNQQPNTNSKQQLTLQPPPPPPPSLTNSSKLRQAEHTFSARFGASPSAPPPPPPPPVSSTLTKNNATMYDSMHNSNSNLNVNRNEDNVNARSALLESIRQSPHLKPTDQSVSCDGVNTKSVNEKNMRHARPIMNKAGNGGPPPPPPPPPPVTAAIAATMPPPPPPLSLGINATTAPIPHSNGNSNGDGRDAFLESIRKGVNLKKVDQKAATISGIKPRADKKPPVTDFLSELKMGITLRRVKNVEDNPFAGDEPDESHA